MELFSSLMVLGPLLVMLAITFWVFRPRSKRKPEDEFPGKPQSKSAPPNHP